MHTNREWDRLGKALIVSYSYSGNTHQIAQAIQAVTGADWCEIYPWQPYPVEFPTLLKQVQGEIKNGYRPRLLPGARPARMYSVVFVGSPNWCGTIAPPIASWLVQNDLSGKTVLPFYSHCGGVPCDFGREITRLCPKAEIRVPLGVLANSGTDLPQLIREWLDKNGLPALPAAYAG